MHMFWIKFATMFPNSEMMLLKLVQCSINISFFLFGLFTIDGDKMLFDGICHNNILHGGAGGT